jgi:hypothetical protein
MTKKEILIKVATMQGLMGAGKTFAQSSKNTLKSVDNKLSNGSGFLSKFYNSYKGLNNRAAENFPKTNLASKLLMGPLPVPGGIMAGAGLKAGITGTQAFNEYLMKKPERLNIFSKILGGLKTAIPT